MKISTKGRYALMVLLDLAQQPEGEFISLKDIAERQAIPAKYLEQIIMILNHSDLLQSARGAGGGYRLARKPCDYRLGDIIRAAEGSLSPLSCLEDSENICARSEHCQTLPFWSGLSRAINEYVDRFTLEDLVFHPEKF